MLEYLVNSDAFDMYPFPLFREHTMMSKVNRRRFLQSAGTGIAAGVTASAAVSALADDDPPAAIPLPDSNTQQPADTTEPQPVCCTPAATIIFPCSGAADVGEIADHAARQTEGRRSGEDVLPGRNRRSRE